MTASLTAREAKALAFITARIAETHVSPLWNEIATHLGLKSKGSVTLIVDHLVMKGFIRHRPNTRLVEIVKKVCPECGFDLHTRHRKRPAVQHEAYPRRWT